MERPAGGSGYRVPSSVFARDKPGNPMDWSSASNESLFSIPTGNMSFTGELYRSAEFNLPSTPEVPTSPEHEDLQLPEPSNPDPIGSNPDHIDNNSPSEVTSKPEKQEVTTNTSDDRRARPSRKDEKGTPASSRSNASGQSFEFPLLEGGLERGGSSVKSGLGTLPEKAESQKKPGPDSNEAQPIAPEAYNGAACPWFSNCMSCFSRCVKTEKEGIGSKD